MRGDISKIDVICSTCQKVIDKADKPSHRLIIDFFHCHECDGTFFNYGEPVPPDFEEKVMAATTAIMNEYRAAQSQPRQERKGS